MKAAFWRRFIETSPHNVGLDAAILMNPQVWIASGHVEGFSDPLIDCRACHSRHRADLIIDVWNEANEVEGSVEGLSNEELQYYISEKGFTSPVCGAQDYTDIRHFNLMIKTQQGVTEDSQSDIYLRPETAQGIFVNFKNVQRTSRRKLPFGIGQIGKAFRIEITPGNFIFRTREFEQMELEFFCEPVTDDNWFDYWRDFSFQWLLDLGLT